MYIKIIFHGSLSLIFNRVNLSSKLLITKMVYSFYFYGQIKPIVHNFFCIYGKHKVWPCFSTQKTYLSWPRTLRDKDPVWKLYNLVYLLFDDGWKWFFQEQFYISLSTCFINFKDFTEWIFIVFFFSFPIVWYGQTNYKFLLSFLILINVWYSLEYPYKEV